MFNHVCSASHKQLTLFCAKIFGSLKWRRQLRAPGCPEGISELGGQEVIVKNGAARLTNGALAGSIITLPEALQHMRNATHCSMLDICKMVSTNPAKQLKLAHDGSIKVGNNANFAVLDNHGRCVQTFSSNHLSSTNLLI
ncbi:MAG: hypothetical protein EXR81_02590 [Gammaproteobacteria bacterium]|nr:hypothetical protein [Gammaproteobacteria bacterium]